MERPERSPAAGSLIDGRYSVVRALGGGSAGAVHAALDLVAGSRMVALKLAPSESPQARAVLAREFGHLRRLVHPHLVSAEHFGLDDGSGRAYFTMEMVAGVHLDRACRDLAPAALAEKIAQLLRGLAFLHSHGLVHLDIKPENVLVDEAGLVRITDLGLACPAGAVAPSRGTPLYAAPETTDPQQAVDGRADLYSLGVILHHLITGEFPVSGRRAAEVLEARERTPAPGRKRSLKPELAGLYPFVRRLLARDPDGRPADAWSALTELAAAAGRGLPLETPETLLAYLRAGELVGRQDELAATGAALSAAADQGQVASLVISGPGGSGRGRLLEEIRHLAEERGFTCAWAEGQRESSPYAVVATLLRQLLPRVRPAALARWAPQLARILPELGLPGTPEPGLAPDDERARLGARVVELVRQVSRRRPLLLAVQAVHRADTGSLELLELLACQRTSMPLAIAVTVNPGAHSTAAQAVRLGALLASPGVRRLELAPLSAEQTEHLLAAMFGRPAPRDFVAALLSATGGNPLFIREALAMLAEAGELWSNETGWRLSPVGLRQRIPARVERIALDHLARLPEESAALVRALAVMNSPLAPEELAGLAEDEPERAQARAAPAVRLGLVRWGRGPDGRPRVAITSPLVQEAILEAIEPEARRRLHDRAWRLLAGRPANDPVELAWHRLRARSPGPKAFEEAVAAARGCTRLAVLDTAAELYAGALALGEPAGPGERRAALLEYAEVLFGTGQFDGVPALLAEALALSADPGERAEVHRWRARSLARSGEPDAAAAALQEGLQEIADRPRGVIWFRLREAEVVVLAACKRLQAAAELAREILAELPEGDLGPELLEIRVIVLNNLGNYLRRLGRWREAAQVFEQELASARALGNRMWIVMAGNNLAAVKSDAGQWDEAESLLLSVLEMAEEIGLPVREAVLHHNLGEAALRRGDTAAAQERFRHQLEICERLGDRPGIALGQLSLGLEEVRQGRLSEAARLLGLALDTAREAAAVDRLEEILPPLLRVHLLSGRLAEAQALAGECRNLAGRLDNPHAFARCEVHLAELALALGRPAEAVARASEAVESFRAGDSGAAELAARVLLARALAAGGDGPAARRECRQIERLLEGPAPASDALDDEVGYLAVLAELGETARLGRGLRRLETAWPAAIVPRHLQIRLWILQASLEVDPVVARRRLRQALEAAENLEMAPLAIEARAELARRALARGRPRRAREEIEAALELAARIDAGLDQSQRGTFLATPAIARLRRLGEEADGAFEAGADLDIEHLERLAGLERQALGFHATLELDDVLARVTQGLLGLTGGERALLLLGQAGQLVPALARASDGSQPSAARLEPDAELLARALAGPAPVLGRDRAAVALRDLEGQVTGALYVSGCRDLDELRAAQPLLAAFADQASAALANARLHRQVQRSGKRAQALARIIQELAETPDLEPLLVRLLDGAVELIHADRGVLLLTGPSGSPEARLARTARHEDLPPGAAQISFSTVRRVQRSRIGVTFLDLGEEAAGSLATDSIRDLALKSVLAAPILRRSEVLGVLYLDSTRSPSRPFDPDDLRLIESLCRAAGVALANARLIEELRDSNRKLLAVDEMKAKFTDLVAHELATPIAIVGGYLQLLSQELAGDLNSEQRASLEGALRAVDRLGEATAAVVNLARLTAGASPIQPRPTRVGALVEEVVSGLRPAAGQRNQRITCRLPARELVHSLDPAAVAVALRNLLLNAIRFTPDGGQIGVQVRTSRRHLEILVSDTGIGIPAEEHERIFRLFYQAADTAHHHSGTTEFRSGGLGLGLAVVRAIAEAHRGEVLVESRPGRGSTFRLRLPR